LHPENKTEPPLNHTTKNRTSQRKNLKFQSGSAPPSMFRAKAEPKK